MSCDTSVILPVLYCSCKKETGRFTIIRIRGEKTKMKKAAAVIMIIAIMILALGTTAFAEQTTLVDRAKQAALNYAGVDASEAVFTKVHRDWENGHQIFEIEFHANNTEYDVDVDISTGQVIDFSAEYRGAGQTGFGGGYSDDFWDD